MSLISLKSKNEVELFALGKGSVSKTIQQNRSYEMIMWKCELDVTLKHLKWSLEYGLEIEVGDGKHGVGLALYDLLPPSGDPLQL